MFNHSKAILRFRCCAKPQLFSFSVMRSSPSVFVRTSHDGSIKHAEHEIYYPSKFVMDKSYLTSMEDYRKMYEESVTEPTKFWSKIADQFYWNAFYPNNKAEWNFDAKNGPISISWFKGAQTNMTYNCLDRHIRNGNGDKTVFYWEGNDPKDSSKLTYNELYTRVCKMANVLKSMGLKKGDVVSLYMPMIPELIVAMLACARIGVVHSIIFAGFSANSLCVRFLSAKPKLVIIADGFWRGNKVVNLKNILDEALQLYSEKGFSVDKVIIKEHLQPSESRGSNSTYKINSETDVFWGDVMSQANSACDPVWLDAEDPLFMLHTSGSTGIPKAILHTIGGYMLYVATTFKYVFDYHPDDIYWCTADLGWVTGHSYICYGPLLNCASSVLFEGVMTYPDPSRFWKICDKYKVNQFYTAPTAIRSLMAYGDDYVLNSSTRGSLRVIGTVGEPINPDVWEWYHKIVGNSRCAIVDTYWQTETGGHILTPLPCFSTKPGSATLPFFGVVPAILNEEGQELEGKADGYLAIKQPWPGMMRNIFENYERFQSTYFDRFPGYYVTGDGAHRDDDGYYWITGRIDDMLNVSGHLLSTAEIEAVLVQHSSVVEAAAVTAPHDIKGECVYCFVTLHQDEELTPKLVQEIKTEVRSTIGPFACPEYVQMAKSMPKTRSGKIIRRALRQIAKGSTDFGDLSSLSDFSVITALQNGREELLKGLR